VSWSVGWGHTSTFIRSLFSSSGIYGWAWVWVVQKFSREKKEKGKKKKENIFLFRGWAPPDDVIHSFHQFCTHTHTHTHERDPKNLFTQFWLEKERKEENLNWNWIPGQQQ
jgi:hypothetical protein